ncbi:hypothetical protein BFW38_01465 [Terasakiispira papahanaumokuakeensis]|uniref:Response regulatory domain-containing protein n=1 Tax=Terasakiispira papahanaumokuakeensis TaxID=197479 RepID=A0A1E2V6X5_9GAMM|nr:response regulator [Terasakiispira papahanaumokuakeensis]ODC02405.1 hypothetical protein BFW38_01465 [Terasakiispira papahanaumokuakeensis]
MPALAQRNPSTVRDLLTQWLQRSRGRMLIWPLGGVLVVWLLLCIMVASLIGQEGADQVARDAQDRVLNSVGLLGHQLDLELSNLEHIGALLGRQGARVMTATPGHTPLMLKQSPEGVRYKAYDDGGGALFFSAVQPAGDQDMRQARRMQAMGWLLKDTYRSHPLVRQLYFINDRTEMVIYPYVDVLKQFSPQVDIRDFMFFYHADPEHNASRKSVWTDAYMDPAGQGWVLTLSQPVYANDEFLGIVGLDLTVEALVQRLSHLNVPWDGYAMLLSRDGTVLAAPAKGRREWDLSDPPSALSEASGLPKDMHEGLLNAIPNNIFFRPGYQDALEPLRSDAAGLLDIQLDQPRTLAWSTIGSTGWKLLLVVPKASAKAGVQLLDYTRNALLVLLTVGLLGVWGLVIYLSIRRDRRFKLRLSQYLEAKTKQTHEPASAAVDTTAATIVALHSFIEQHSHGPLVLCHYDDQGLIIHCNAPFEAFAGDIRKRLKGQPISHFVPLDSQTKEVWYSELRRSEQHDDGLHEWMAIMTPLQSGGGLLSMFDISEFRRAQQQLRNEYQRLEAASKLRSEFVQVASREAEQLVDQLIEQSDVESPDMPSEADRLLMTLRRLLHDLDDMTQEMGTRSGAPQWTSLSRVLKALQVHLDHELSVSGRRLRLPSDPQLETLAVDDARLLRLLMLLVRHCLTYSQQGDIDMEYRLLSNTQLKLTLTDQGDGLDMAVRRNLFEPMTPLDSRYERARQSHDMILVRQLLRELNGQLDVRQAVDAFTLVLTLPLPEGVTIGLNTAMANPVMKRPRILVVDDGPVNSMLARTVLEKSGFDVDVAASGHEALKLGREQQYALVLMDIFMPEMDGLEATLRWRQLPNDNADIPVIAITANALPEDRERFINAGMNDFFAKPYRPAELRQCVTQWLGE